MNLKELNPDNHYLLSGGGLLMRAVKNSESLREHQQG